MRLLFGEMSSILLDGQRVVPLRLLDLGFRFRFPEADAALRNVMNG
jgi:NAD dependent epimerase/dehydratase family enzyme